MVVESGGVGGFCPVIWLKSFASLELLASLNDGKLVPSKCLEHLCTLSALISTDANHESTSNIDDCVTGNHVKLLAAMHHRCLVFLRVKLFLLPDIPQLPPPAPRFCTHTHTRWTDKAQSRGILTDGHAIYQYP